MNINFFGFCIEVCVSILDIGFISVCVSIGLVSFFFDTFSAFVTNKHEGTGVGLSLCKSLVEKHRGHISFADNPNGGTIFTVELPIELAKSTEVSPLKNAVEVAL